MFDQAARHFLNCGVTGVVGCDLKSGLFGGLNTILTPFLSKDYSLRKALWESHCYDADGYFE